MNIIDFLNEQKKWTESKYNLWKAYHSDYEEYKHWQYHNPNVKTQNALEAKILRQTHVIEKGMSLSHPREKFGVQKAMELLDFIGEFVECGYNIKDSAPVMNALGVLRAYLAYHEERGFKPEEVLKKFEKYSICLLYTSKALPEHKDRYIAYGYNSKNLGERIIRFLQGNSPFISNKIIGEDVYKRQGL